MIGGCKVNSPSHFASTSRVAQTQPAETTTSFVPDTTHYDKRHAVSVAIDVISADPSQRWYSRVIDAQDFQRSLEVTITKTGLFTEVVPPGLALFVMRCTIVQAGCHQDGSATTAWMTTEWVAHHGIAGGVPVLLEQRVHTTATVSSEEGEPREAEALRLAAKANIDRSMAWAAGLDLRWLEEKGASPSARYRRGSSSAAAVRVTDMSS
ncbi:MAG: hypothetical protein AAGA57_05270 [Planctomycetota bacterium]